MTEHRVVCSRMVRVSARTLRSVALALGAVLLLAAPTPVVVAEDGAASGKPARFGQDDDAQPLRVFAAASLAEAVDALQAEWAAQGGAPWSVSLAASSTLARQIDAGAPADLFLSASRDWAEWLAGRDAIAGGIHAFAGNSLVLIAPAGAEHDLGPDASVIAEGGPQHCVPPGPLTAADLAHGLAALAADARIAVADPDHVPAGIYARQAFRALGSEAQFESRIARADNVRGALWLVARGECPLGVVYATDAHVASGVHVVALIPDAAHDPIEYVALIPRGHDSPHTRALIEFLGSTPARSALLAAGFTVPDVSAGCSDASC